MTGHETQTPFQEWSLASLFGYENPLFIIHHETVLYTWALLIILAITACIGRFLLRSPGKTRFIALAPVVSMIEIIKQSLGFFSFPHFAFIFTLFIFIALANTLSIIPWLDEPTNDINTTLALGIISFAYTQYTAISHNGLWPYIKGYFSPIFIMFPLNVIGKLASIVSLAFRLFGNIAGGAIILIMYLTYIVRNNVYTELFFIGAFSVLIALAVSIYKRSSLATTMHMAMLALFFSSNMLMTLFFIVFEGFLQAFVFTMLSLTYLSSALQSEGH